MSPKLVRAFTVGAIAVGAATMAHAQQSSPANQGVDVGKWEYDGNCAACHGENGKGFGPVVGSLKQLPPDLTMLAKNNAGVFPFARVYDVIDGRQPVAVHGPRDMPIWGRHYSAMNSALSPYPYFDNEAFARAKILALTEYIYRLQAK